MPHLVGLRIFAGGILALLFVSVPGQSLATGYPPVAQGEGQSSTDEKIEIDDLRVPASPAFVLLGVTPTAVERPTTPKALAVGLITSADRENILPNNYALDFAPYWLVEHPNLTFDDYYAPGFFQGMLQTLSLSVASSKRELKTAADSDATVDSTAMAVGLRTLLVAGAPNPGLAAKREELRLTDIEIFRLEDKLEEEGADVDAITKQIEELEDSQVEVRRALRGFDTQRVGFRLDLAGAAVWDFPENQTSSRELTSWGIWITPAYSWALSETAPAPSVEALFVGRIRSDQAIFEEERTTRWELGGRLNWMATEPLTVSVEALVQRALDKEAATQPPTAISDARNTHRIVGFVQYEVADSIYLFASFGRDFSSDTVRSDLVSVFGIDLGFGKKPLASPPR